MLSKNDSTLYVPDDPTLNAAVQKAVDQTGQNHLGYSEQVEVGKIVHRYLVEKYPNGSESSFPSRDVSEATERVRERFRIGNENRPEKIEEAGILGGLVVGYWHMGRKVSVR